MTPDKPLAGKSILVTRPAHQAQALAALVRAAGGNAILFPVIEIRDIENTAPLLELIDRLDQFDIAIFVSPNAASRGWKLISSRHAPPIKLAVVAVGPSSAKELARFGVTGVTMPAGRTDSEGLLELPLFANTKGKRVIIFRGVGGRELLGETLAARGAVVEYAECYRRTRPEADPTALVDAWRRRELDAVTVTSGEGLANLLEMVGEEGRTRLADSPLFAPHPRIAQAARDRGFANVVVTGPGDEGMVDGLIEYFKGVTGER